jgi:glutathione peroxidase
MRITWILLATLLILLLVQLSCGLDKRQIAKEAAVNQAAVVPPCSFITLDGQELDLPAANAKATLLVNTASKCGFTGQYEGLQALHERFAGRGLLVVGLPCNDFMGQEPGSGEEILNFCSMNFDVSFPLTEKLHVKGEEQHPLYTFLTTQSPVGLNGAIKWNFTKFLLDASGRPVARFEPAVKPLDDELIAAIEKLLGE